MKSELPNTPVPDGVEVSFFVRIGEKGPQATRVQVDFGKGGCVVDGLGIEAGVPTNSFPFQQVEERANTVAVNLMAKVARACTTHMAKEHRVAKAWHCHVRMSQKGQSYSRDQEAHARNADRKCVKCGKLTRQGYGYSSAGYDASGYVLRMFGGDGYGAYPADGYGCGRDASYASGYGGGQDGYGGYPGGKDGY
eukprot:4529951-Amphidinium_carterae.1